MKHQDPVKLATSQDMGPQKVAEEGKSPYFREIKVGETLSFGQIKIHQGVHFFDTNIRTLQIQNGKKTNEECPEVGMFETKNHGEILHIINGTDFLSR